MTDRARPGLVALYDIRPGNGAGQFLQPRSKHGAYKQTDTDSLPAPNGLPQHILFSPTVLDLPHSAAFMLQFLFSCLYFGLWAVQ